MKKIDNKSREIHKIRGLMQATRRGCKTWLELNDKLRQVYMILIEATPQH
jgi:hypothetical protein